MHNIVFQFPAWVWQHLPYRVRKLGETSVIGSFCSALLAPVNALFLPTTRDLFNACFERSRSGSELVKTGTLYKLSKMEAETDAEFLIRLLKKKVINRSGNTKKAVKEIVTMMLGVSVEITEEYHLPGFVVGETSLGTATCAESSYYAFVSRIILPDLSNQAVNHEIVRGYIDEYSPNNEFRIFETRSTGLYEWE